jgi:hypothetical protein
MASTLPPGELFALDALVTPTAQGIASRVLARTAAGNMLLIMLREQTGGESERGPGSIQRGTSGSSARRK